MKIVFHIERLVLDGVDMPASGRHLLQPAIEAELDRLFASDALARTWRSGASVAHVAAPCIVFGTGDNAIQLGQGVASSLHRSLAR